MSPDTMETIAAFGVLAATMLGGLRWIVKDDYRDYEANNPKPVRGQKTPKRNVAPTHTAKPT